MPPRAGRDRSFATVAEIPAGTEARRSASAWASSGRWRDDSRFLLSNRTIHPPSFRLCAEGSGRLRPSAIRVKRTDLQARLSPTLTIPPLWPPAKGGGDERSRDRGV